MSTYKNDEYALRDFVTVAKAISDPSRLRILLALGRGEVCACQLVKLLGIASSTVSRHMSILEKAYLIDVRRDGRWAFYRGASAGAPEPVLAALDWIDASLGASPIAVADAKRLAEITRVPLEELRRKRDDS